MTRPSRELLYLRQALSDAYPLAADRAVRSVADVSDEVDQAERAVSRALQALENNWPTVSKESGS